MAKESNQCLQCQKMIGNYFDTLFDCVQEVESGLYF